MTVVRLAATAAGSAVSAGLAVVAATVLGVRTIHTPGAGPIEFGFPYYLLLFGTIGGSVVAGAVAWALLSPIGSTYRRGGLALVCAFATFIVMLVCTLVDRWFGRPGLAGLFVITAAIAVLLARRSRRAGAVLLAGDSAS